MSDGFLVLPFYAVCDESSSMADEVDTVNTSLKELHSEIVTQPVIADKTRFALIGFSTEARELLRLSDLSTVSSMPGIVADGLTAYGRVFSLLRDVIERDVRNLKNDGLRVYRPTVFFLSDGLPTDPDEWPEEHARLVDQSWTYRPNIIAFGIGQADAQTIGQVATLKAYMVNDGVNPAAALQEWARSLTKSIVASASATEDGQVRLVVPPPPEGFTEVQLDEL
ncbi:MAG: VWA domain-containing protein [Thermoanaerobacterales bacterium]